jgi:hypothetical protein
MKNHFKVEKCRQEIINKYSFIVDKDGIWNLSDTQKAWGKIQRMFKCLTRTRWSLSVLAKVRKWDEKLFRDNHDRTLKRDTDRLKALGEQIKTLKEEIQQLQKKSRKNQLAPHLLIICSLNLSSG